MLITERRGKKLAAEKFVAALLKRKEPLTEFDERFWFATVESVTVYSKEDIRVTWRGNE